LEYLLVYFACRGVVCSPGQLLVGDPVPALDDPSAVDAAAIAQLPAQE